MELRVIDKTDEELRIEIGGEDHTFMNVLKGALLETDGVTAATYDVNPEQSGGQTDPVLSIKTEEGVDPLDALADGARAVQDTADDFTTAFNTALDA
ncbi:DNA-directed RNA polymerase subunit L [Haloferax sp. DFSO60]|uniref:DNA-directed RNA polymerase subunit L n=1 Tax=Haloferax sp. DFSO60 TaxID=3388652 RepID=UPI00397996F1